MVSGLGETSVAAIGIANQVFFLFNMSLSGVAGGASVFIAQFYGKEDVENIRKVVALSCAFALLLALAFITPIIVKPEIIIHIFSYDPEVVKICKEYFSIVIFSYPLIAISVIFSTGSRSIRNPKLGMICSMCALTVSIIIKYGLIFGNFGLPTLGVKGAAIGTLSARIVELGLLITYVYIYKKDYALKFKLQNIKSITTSFTTSYLSKGIPIFLNDAAWAFGTVLYAVAYSKAGTSAIASSQIATTTGNFFMMTCVCIASSGGIMLGNELGANNIKKAILYAKKFSFLVILAGVIMGGLLITCIPLLLKMFNVSSALAPNIIKIFIILGALMPLKAFNTLIIVGILRSGGDTKYALILEQASIWFAALPLTFFAAFKGYPIYILFLLTYSEELLKFIFGLPRVLTKKWASNFVNEM